MAWLLVAVVLVAGAQLVDGGRKPEAVDDIFLMPDDTLSHLDCLAYQVDGCNEIHDASECLASRDGRDYMKQLNGHLVYGEPCVWCGPETNSCGEGKANCEPYGFLNGTGFFKDLHHRVANCSRAIELDCLSLHAEGCNDLTDATTCLASRDGRKDMKTLEGHIVYGEPCVWCGPQEDSCSVGRGNRCEPYGYLHGKRLYDSKRDRVAGCSRPELECLKLVEDGCTDILDATTCLASRDGREYMKTLNGYMIYGEPCVWCGPDEDSCGVGNGNRCEPFDFLKGRGLYKSKRDRVASCSSAELQCLNYHADGCTDIMEATKCLASRDGRDYMKELDGYLIYGEPCVWCGPDEDSCGIGNGNKCEPYDFLKGKGQYQRSRDRVASCTRNSKLSCLGYYGDGCSAIRDKETCLASRDGRDFMTTLNGYLIYGEPCVWCGNGDDACGTGDGNPCEPYDLLKSQGLYQRGRDKVARCTDGKPAFVI